MFNFRKKKNLDAIAITKLDLKPGDILLVERSFELGDNIIQRFNDAAKLVGMGFDVPIIFVNKIDGIAILRGSNG